jgi:hypothetical protein
MTFKYIFMRLRFKIFYNRMWLTLRYYIRLPFRHKQYAAARRDLKAAGWVDGAITDFFKRGLEINLKNKVY